MAIRTSDEGNLVGFRIEREGSDRHRLNVTVYSENADCGYIAFSAISDKGSSGLTALQQAEMFIVYEVLPNLITTQTGV